MARLCAQIEDLEFKVFYVLPVKMQQFDSEYDQTIDWGDDLLAGYVSEQFASTGELASAVQKWQADVVMLYGYGWSGAPRIIFSNWWRGMAQIHRGTLNYYLDPRRPIKGRLLRPLGRLLLRLFNAHHYGGDYSRKVLLDAGVKETALFFVPYSVNTPYFLMEAENPNQKQTAQMIRESQGWLPTHHVILFIAQHNWFKGPDIAMQVFRQIAKADPQARFLVVGSGRMTDAMKDDSRQNFDSKTIHFAGFVPSSQTVAYYLASDLVICTSRYETWARMINEAMLCNRPCLVSRVVPAAGGLVVDGENGHVVESPEASLFVSAIKMHFALSREMRQQMGRAACEKAKTFAYAQHVDNVIAAARYALKQSRCGRAKMISE